MKKVSVIIPVYNAEKYLPRCLDSVVNQTLRDIEIICIDDCSEDISLEILNNYSERNDNMIIVKNAKNCGESSARNKGLEIATGEYLAFVDNDDELDLDFFEKLYSTASSENADICKGEVKIYEYNGKMHIGGLNKKIRENENNILFFAYHWWTAIFKRSIVKNNNLRFLENYPLGGDVLFLNEVILKSERISLVDTAYYNYHKRVDSGDSLILSEEKINSVLAVHEKIVDNINNTGIKNNGVDFIYAWCLEVCFSYAHRLKTIENLQKCVHSAYVFFNKIPNTDNLQPYLTPFASLILEKMKTTSEKNLVQYFLTKDSPKKQLLAELRKKIKNSKNT